MQSPDRFALMGATLIDGNGNDPIENSTVLIESGKIAGVNRTRDFASSSDCRVLDVSGMTILPGMIDLHVHLASGGEAVAPRVGLPAGLERSSALNALRTYAAARRTLDMGFTTVRDVGDAGYSTVAVRDAVSTGLLEGPRIFPSGQYLTTTGGHADGMPIWLQRTDLVPAVADGVDGVVLAVRRQIKMNVNCVKFFATGGVMDGWDEQEFSDDEMSAIVNEAHGKGRPVAAHAMYARGTVAAIKAGVDTIEHGTHLTEEAVDLMCKRGTYLVPTLSAPVGVIERGAALGLPESYIANVRPLMEPTFASFRMAREAGVKIAMGTDVGFGPCSHGTNAYELELMVRQGMSVMQAIVATTKSAAEVLRLSEKLGTIEPGKWADLVVVNGNPLDDIRLLQEQGRIALVVKAGAVYANRLPC